MENSVDLQTRQALDVSKLIAQYAHNGETGRTELSHKIMETHFHAKMQTRFVNRVRRGLDKGLDKNEKIIKMVDDLLSMAWTEFT